MAGMFVTLIKNPQITTAIAISTFIGLRLGKETLFLGYYKDKLLQSYKDGVETPVDKHTKTLAQEVLDKFQLRPEAEADLQLFTCFSQDAVYGGSTHLKTGSIIGLPANFAYKSVNDIDKSKLTIGQKAIKWDTPEGTLFAESLILSDDAKRFAIARQINYLDSLEIYVDNGFLLCFSMLGYWVGHAANVLLHLKRKLPTFMRGSLYVCIASVGATLYFLAKDEYICYLDEKVDRKSADFGKEYAAGGIEFYAKELQRNKALRCLLGDYGKKVYTKYGNYVTTWRLRHPPPITRHEKMEKFSTRKVNEENARSEKVNDGTA
ncbi:transmembrane protein 177-like [Lineus longissimus]|uniref:transmembrane protein 177-like n=1 Tax=Lineus longissimus TaxID=88925 RepID=UPI002B4D4D4B